METTRQYPHLKEVTIKALRKLEDDQPNQRYSIIGKVGKMGTDFFILDDTTSKIGIRMNQQTSLFPEGLKIIENELYRVYGKIEKTPDGILQVQADIIQEMKGIDIQTFLKVKQKKHKMVN
ncbi:MAG: OB-fold nucleic acid binding domain-containing protein [Candidatus Helarchaeota archaeon]